MKIKLKQFEVVSTGSDGNVVMNRQGNIIEAKHYVVIENLSGTIRYHEVYDGTWEVWFAPLDDPSNGHCIASSANPPDRHYDE